MRATTPTASITRLPTGIVSRFWIHLVLLLAVVVPHTAAAYNCGRRPWGQILVTVSNPLPGATTTYSIFSRVPFLAGCDLTKYSAMELTFPAGTNAETVIFGTLNGQAVNFLEKAANRLVFESPVTVRYGQAVNIVLFGVTNPTIGGRLVALTLAAQLVLNGSIDATISSPYSITLLSPTPTPTITPTRTATPTGTFTLLPGQPTYTPPEEGFCGGASVTCCNGVVDGGEECDNGGRCVGGPNGGNPCLGGAGCPGGACVPFGGDGCANNCTNETTVRFEYTGDRCFGGFKNGQACTGIRTCRGGPFPDKLCSSAADCGPANNRGACISECTTFFGDAGDGSECFGVGECIAGAPNRLGTTCPTSISPTSATAVVKICRSGTAPGLACSVDADCPGGDTGACANPCSPTNASGVCRHRSGMILQSIGLVGALSIGPVIGGQDLVLGKPAADGLVPVAVPAASITAAPITIPGLGCACLSGVALPDQYGPNNAGAGVIACGSGGLPNVNIDISRDHDTTPGDENNGPGTCSGGARNGLACAYESDCLSGVCNARFGGGGMCVGGANKAMVCHADADCPGSICVSPDDPTCSAQEPPTALGSGSSACLEGQRVCASGPRKGELCSVNRDCGIAVACGTFCNPTSLHPGICNGPNRLSYSGSGGSGSAILASNSALGIIAVPNDDGRCSRAGVCTTFAFNVAAPLVACERDLECSAGHTCASAYCAGTCTTGSKMGSPCIRASDCGAGGFCSPGSHFSEPCTGAGNECGSNSLCVPAVPAKGLDGLPCTADDPPASQGTPQNWPMTTGLASAAVIDATDLTNVPGHLIAGDTCSGRANCATSRRGAAFNCDALFGPNPSASGATLASAFNRLDVPIIGDNVVTSALTAK